MNPLSSVPEPEAVASREDVTFRSGDAQCAAWLYRPEDVPRPPVVVMAHGFGAVKVLRLDAYAERFAAAGYAVLVFDYRHFGDSEGQPRELLSLSRQHEDWTAAIAFARSLRDVDTSRVVLWGSSLSGGHVLREASRDHELAAVIAQVPHVSGPVAAWYMGLPHLTRLAVPALRDLTRQVLRRPPHYLPSIGDTGTVAVMVADDGQQILARLAQDVELATIVEQNRVAGRILLHMPFYSPGRHAGRITAPTLIQAGERDELTPMKASRRAAGRIKDVEFRAYPCGHFDPYVLPHFERIVGDQVAFLQQHVPVAR